MQPEWHLVVAASAVVVLIPYAALLPPREREEVGDYG
jgi:hypothetical protein